jgi:hypothetical protein
MRDSKRHRLETFSFSRLESSVISWEVMRRFVLLILFLATCLVFDRPARAADFKLKDGTVMTGEPVSPDLKGVIIKAEGKLGTRTPWDKFSQESLKELVKDPKCRKFAELLIEVSPDQEQEVDIKPKVRPKKPEIKIKEVAVPEMFASRPGLFAGFISPMGFFILMIIVGANAYAGYEIARYRRRPASLVSGVSIVAPFIGPIVFLCMPTVSDEADKPVSPESTGDSTDYKNVLDETTGHHAAAAVEEEEVVEDAAPVIPATQTFKRGEFTFNRRFVETKFAGFFRLVPAEADKDLLLTVTSQRGNFTGKRIVKTSPNDLVLLIAKGDATAEETIPFNEIMEIQIRHKDAPA